MPGATTSTTRKSPCPVANTYRLYCYGKGGASDGVITGNWVDFYSDTVLEGGFFHPDEVLSGEALDRVSEISAPT